MVNLKSINNEDEFYTTIYGDPRTVHSRYTYAELLKLEAELTKAGTPPCRADWNCPVCKIRWKNCPHEAIKCYFSPPCPGHYGYAFPTWEDRPWR